jgi:hypothetical protein
VFGSYSKSCADLILGVYLISISPAFLETKFCHNLIILNLVQDIKYRFFLDLQPWFETFCMIIYIGFNGHIQFQIESPQYMQHLSWSADSLFRHIKLLSSKTSSVYISYCEV